MLYLLLKRMTTGLIIGLLFFPVITFASEKHLGDGFQVSLAGANSNFFNIAEFDGESYLKRDESNGQLIIDIPQPTKTGFGFAGRLGYKYGKWACELQYSQSAHEKERSLLEQLHGKLVYTFYDANIKHYFIQQSNFKSYVIFGMAYATLDGEKIRLNPSSSGYERSTYNGITYNLGVGFNYYINNSVFLFTDYIYRGLSFAQVDDMRISEMLSSPMHTFYLGLGYAFGH